MKKVKPKRRKAAKAPTRRRPMKSAKGKARKLQREPAIKLSRNAAEELLRQMQSAITKLRATLTKHKAQSVERSERVQKWLNSAQAKEFLQKDPKLKEVFARATAAAKALPKEQVDVISAHEKALDKVQAQLATFPVK
jgi:hypothetical protein